MPSVTEYSLCKRRWMKRESGIALFYSVARRAIGRLSVNRRSGIRKRL
jgi:hypothetical protein